VDQVAAGQPRRWWPRRDTLFRNTDSFSFGTLASHRRDFGLFVLAGNGFVIPVHMRRPLFADRTSCLFPVLTALRTDAAGIEGVPNASASGHAHPTVERPRNPLASGTKYFYFAHA